MAEYSFKTDWYSSQAIIPMLSPIENFTATPITKDTINLSWDSQTTYDKYEIQRAESPDFLDAVQIHNDAANGSLDDTGLAQGVTYYYRIRGILEGTIPA